MGVDLFLDYTCPFRPKGETADVMELLRARSYAQALRSDPSLPRDVLVSVVDRAGETRKRRYSGEAFDRAETKLNQVFDACATCPANAKAALGITDTIGCHVRVHLPLDGLAERVLYEAMQEAAKPERFETDQGNFIRAMIARRGSAGIEISNPIAEHARQKREMDETDVGTHTVSFDLGGMHAHISVYALEEALLLQARFPARAVGDLVLFFRSFFAIVGRYVVDENGNLDPEKNVKFWRQSRSLQELNLLAQALTQAKQVGAGLIFAQ